MNTAVVAEVWMPIIDGSTRTIEVQGLHATLDGSVAYYVSRYSTARGRITIRVEVRCNERRRAVVTTESPPTIRPFPFLSFEQLEPDSLAEAEFACRWAADDPVAKSRVAMARLNPTSAEQPNQGQLHQSAPAATTVPAKAAKREPIALGSGFVVGTRLAVTNQHVVDGCETLTVRQGDEVRTAEVQSSHTGFDLALLSLSGPLGSPVSIRSAVSLGEDVMVAGHPLSGFLASDIVVTSGQVNSLSGLKDEPTLFQLSAGIHSGNSGGPVLDRFGALVGVVVAKVDALKFGRATGEIPQNLNFAIKPEVLRLFLDTHRVRYVNAVGGRRLEGVELAGRARGVTVQIVCQD
ncbi:serine protease [Ramlibacter sp.]|uniref:S1 family peptidase n=1 Tax=Ramlibacter sp. TaxID=1917967 RepID=UPI0035AEEE0B